MGTINTAEVAKKNPSVYIEMVQQKADLDLAALENSRQLSLLYLETYARENNLSESEKIHLENVIDYKVFTEEAAVKKSLWERIKAAFKRLFDWLFGKGSPKIREEDMNKEVKCKFDVDDVNKQASGIEGLVRKLTGSQTKGDATANAQELSNTVSKLKEYGSKTGWTIATLAAVDALKKTLGNILSSTSTAMESFEKSYNAEMEKYNKEDLSDEEKEKRDELKDVNDSVTNALKQLHTDIAAIEKEVTRLSTLSAEGKLDEANKDDEGKEEKKETNPNAAKMAALSGDDGSSGSAPKNSDPFINWINAYHFKYTKSELQSGVPIVMMGDDSSYSDAISKLETYNNRPAKTVNSNDLDEVIKAAHVNQSKYVIGEKPATVGGTKEVHDYIKKAFDRANLGANIAEKVIIPALYGSSTDWYHGKIDIWERISNDTINGYISGYVKAKGKAGFKHDDYLNNNINQYKSSQQGKQGAYRKGLNKETTDWVLKIVNIIGGPQTLNYSGWETNPSQALKDAIKTGIGITAGANTPDPVYYH